MSKNLHARFIRFLILCVIGLAIGFAIAFYTSQNNGQSSQSSQSHAPVLATSIGGDFTLVDQDGVVRTQKDYEGKYQLIYFGFTYCPAICPTELSKLSEAYLALPAEQQAKVQPLFITIDPERDTPEVMKGYVGLFMPQLVGLTGSVEQVDAVKKAYKIYAAKVPDEGSNDPKDYTMDHSSFVYLLDPEGKALGLFKTSDSSEDIRKRLLDVVQ